MKIKTSELTGPALDWAVAKCEGRINQYFAVQWEQGHRNYSTDWAQGGPVIEREMDNGLFLAKRHKTCGALYVHSVLGIEYYGPTPLIAAMRCYVASKLGDEIEVPDKLTRD